MNINFIFVVNIHVHVCVVSVCVCGCVEDTHIQLFLHQNTLSENICTLLLLHYFQSA